MPIFEAWNELSSARSLAGAVLGPIPFTAIDRYAERYGPHDLDIFDDFRRAIRALDSFYLAWKAPTQGGT